MKRYGMVIKLRPEKLGEYKKYHAEVWPDGEWWADMEEVFHTD